MKLQFAKMHGVGNDVMVVSWPVGVALPGPAQIRLWADRRLGPGFDQLMLIDESYSGPADAAYRVFNADGGEVEQCGNGVRCVAQYLAARSDSDTLTLESAAGIVTAKLLGEGRVTVGLGEPKFSPDALPFVAAEGEASSYELFVAEQRVEFGAVSMGNPHAVIDTDSVDDAPVGILGGQFQEHDAFPSGVNVGFMEIRDTGRVGLRVFERGVGETQACGTGAAAAVAVGRDRGRLAERVAVSLPGGELEVFWQGRGNTLWLSGPTTRVYEGQIDYEPTEG
ncbi:MAG: diaminopimelate epimerase [Candidatus Rariloculaceae bacterium]